ncbi:DUF4123 domain-containing protein [Acinetobacter larvae]|uniref:Uncharacterized protein n=1 Tax=Acinetobacter larvae TaxID=1789224 RepID=A0A1B2LZ07_9GAMM|nr:hypothetical protein [Acinetobacter larvae]AOA58165.1 hypothetical protein BFG52_07225 [Acinetobacter larvae]
MLVNPIKEQNIEFDYALVDPNLNSNYLYELEGHLISLAPDYAQKISDSFPYLINLNNIDEDLLERIIKDDEKCVAQGFEPFFILKFKSYPTREPDIVEHLRLSIIFEMNEKKYLYRFYDPKIWILLNFFKTNDFIFKNKNFQYIQIGLLGYQYLFFIPRYEGSINEVDPDILFNININNRLILKKGLRILNFEQYLIEVEKRFNLIHKIKNIGLKKQDDIISTLYHVELLGVQYLETKFFIKLKDHSKGYAIASQRVIKLDWNNFFQNYDYIEDAIKEKVMYV